MFGKPSLITRIAVGKSVGLLFGIAGFVMMPWFLPEPNMMLRWAILLWYTTFGAIIAVFGVFTWHPILRLPMPWWIRAPFVGAWLNFVLSLFIYDQMEIWMTNFFGPNGMLQSPFWMVAEGAIIGFIIGFLATRLGGEGAATIDH